jgi:hypothetical protein
MKESKPFIKGFFCLGTNRPWRGKSVDGCDRICDYRRGLDWWIGFIDHLYIPLETTSNYSGITDLHTLQITFPRLLCLQQPYPNKCF